MATREQATISANQKRMDRNSARIKSDDAFNRGKPATQARFSQLEQLKRVPTGKSGQKQWRPSKRSKASGR